MTRLGWRAGRGTYVTGTTTIVLHFFRGEARAFDTAFSYSLDGDVLNLVDIDDRVNGPSRRAFLRH
jgi:hypothetical protein